MGKVPPDLASIEISLFQSSSETALVQCGCRPVGAVGDGVLESDDCKQAGTTSCRAAYASPFASPARSAEEDYLTWIRRATHEAVGAAKKAGSQSWIEQHAKSKWLWAGHVARKEQYMPESWDYIATFWRDARWRTETASEYRPLRPRAGHQSRWEDSIVKF